MPIVRIDGVGLSDWECFHDVFAEALGFPDFYGRNMNAWIDCLTSIDAPEDGMTSIHGSATDPLVIHIDNADSIPAEIFDGLIECAGFVNWRRSEVAEPAVVALSFARSQRTPRGRRAAAHSREVCAIGSADTGRAGGLGSD